MYFFCFFISSWRPKSAGFGKIRWILLLSNALYSTDKLFFAKNCIYFYFFKSYSFFSKTQNVQKYCCALENVARCARSTIRCSHKSRKRKINSVLPSVAGDTHIHISGVGNRADIFVAITDRQTDGRTDRRTDRQKNNKPPQDISLSIEMNNKYRAVR